MRPRLRHVAEVAGVSQATVSRVLNDKSGVAEATRRDVLRAMTELGYEPVGAARSRRTGLVGLIVPELDNPVFPRFAQALESRLAGDDLVTLLCTSTPAGMQEGDELDVLLEHAVAGIIVVSGQHADTAADHARYHDLAARRVPTVLVNGRPDDLAILPAVTIDHVAAARDAVAHLAALGHRRVGLAIGPRRYLASQELRRGYDEGRDAAGLDGAGGELVSDALYGIEGGHAAGRDLLDRGATAIVCGSDLMALGVIRSARDRRLSVPGDVSVVGFDDAGPNPFVDPPLTSVRQPYEAMSTAVVQLLLDHLADPAAPATELRFRPELVVRASTAPAPPT